jgi:hypothetical protein
VTRRDVRAGAHDGRRLRPAAGIAAAAAIAVVLAGCSPVGVHRNTRYYFTEDLSGTSIRLKRGDEVTFNLVIRNGLDWTAVSSDPNVTRPAGRTIMVFGNGERSRFIDFTLVHAGHATLTACPSDVGTCSTSTPGAVIAEVDVA